VPSTVWREKRETIRHYDELASIYDSLYGDEQELKIEHILEHIAFRSSDLALDAGCGTGLLFEYICRHNCCLVGVDLSMGLLRVASARTKQAGVKTVSLVRADVDYLPFRKRVFDKVFALTLFQDVSYPKAVLTEFLEKAKDDSIFVVTGLKKTFSKEGLGQVLAEADLRFKLLETSEQVKDIIAVCWKHRKQRINNSRAK
jgi:ubiquinone/menaquinone biosynthesis C-methylase UbiE